MNLHPLSSTSARPARSYEEAVERAGAMQALDGAEVNPLSRTRLLSHGHRTERSIVFLHGLTNSPRQFEALGERFHALGYNVLLPRTPHHGLQNRLTDAPSTLSAEALAAHADEAVDIARGLGEAVTVVGLSLGGTMAGWVAQHRADVTQAVLIAPGFGLRPLPSG